VRSLLYLILAGVLALVLGMGICTGRFRSYQMSLMYRDRQPVRYWSIAAVQAGIIAVLLTLSWIALIG
jgi:hypothetical protein